MSRELTEGFKLKSLADEQLELLDTVALEFFPEEIIQKLKSLNRRMYHIGKAMHRRGLFEEFSKLTLGGPDDV